MPPPNASPTTTSAAIAPIFISISALCTLLPARAPKQLIAVRTEQHRGRDRAVAPRHSAEPRGSSGAKVTATAAIPPVCVTSSSTQP